MQSDLEAADSILEGGLRELAGAGAVREFRVFGLRGGGLGIAAVSGMTGPGNPRVLAASRGGVRRFASLDTAANFLRELDVRDFRVDVTHYEPGRVRASRPDRSEALKRTRTAPRQASLLA
ncbi:MAG: hypothetical protein EON54_07125 [Alcaligenaceae bacterium]|nr:MAG: hypothetical protein EON54_07125 [Alcaligenaceae bacterium]